MRSSASHRRASPRSSGSPDSNRWSSTTTERPDGDLRPACGTPKNMPTRQQKAPGALSSSSRPSGSIRGRRSTRSKGRSQHWLVSRYSEVCSWDMLHPCGIELDGFPLLFQATSNGAVDASQRGRRGWHDHDRRASRLLVGEHLPGGDIRQQVGGQKEEVVQLDIWPSEWLSVIW